MEAATALFVSFIVGILIDFLSNAFFFITDFIVASLTLMPTDPFTGILDLTTESFVTYLPWVNWFVPLDFAVTLFGTYLDVYALYIIYTYTRQVIKSILNGGSIKSMAAAIIGFGG